MSADDSRATAAKLGPSAWTEHKGAPYFTLHTPRHRDACLLRRSLYLAVLHAPRLFDASSIKNERSWPAWYRGLIPEWRRTGGTLTSTGSSNEHKEDVEN